MQDLTELWSVSSSPSLTIQSNLDHHFISRNKIQIISYGFSRSHSQWRWAAKEQHGNKMREWSLQAVCSLPPQLQPRSFPAFCFQASKEDSYSWTEGETSTSSVARTAGQANLDRGPSGERKARRGRPEVPLEAKDERPTRIPTRNRVNIDVRDQSLSQNVWGAWRVEWPQELSGGCLLLTVGASWRAWPRQDSLSLLLRRVSFYSEVTKHLFFSWDVSFKIFTLNQRQLLFIRRSRLYAEWRHPWHT